MAKNWKDKTPADVLADFNKMLKAAGAPQLKVEISDPHRGCAAAITDYCNCEGCRHAN